MRIGFQITQLPNPPITQCSGSTFRARSAFPGIDLSWTTQRVGTEPNGRRRKQMLWRGFQKPKRLAVDTSTLTDKYGIFWAQPFERCFGTTVGNALRRVLLSSIEGEIGRAHV